MANKLYEESHIQNIANAIRGKTGKSDLLDVSEMAGEISNISAGLDTSDATVTASDLAEGVVAYGSNGRIVGSVKTVDSGWIRDENENTTVSSGSITNDGVTTKLIKSKYKFTSNNLFRSGSFVEVGVNVNEFGDATATDVLEGRTFTSADGLKVVGTGTLKMFTWEKYSTTNGTTSEAYSQQEVTNKYGTKLSSTTITLYSSMSFNANTGVFTLSGSNINNWGNVYSNKTYQTHPYYFVDDAHTKVAKISSMTPPRTGSIVQNYGVNYTEYYSLANEQGFVKGSYIEDVTSTYSHEYPADGYQDGYWYVLKSEGGSGGSIEGLENGYDVMFYDEFNDGLAFYSIKQGHSINAPVYNCKAWQTADGQNQAFPFTPTEDIVFYANNNTYASMLYKYYGIDSAVYPYITIFAKSGWGVHLNFSQLMPDVSESNVIVTASAANPAQWGTCDYLDTTGGDINSFVQELMEKCTIKGTSTYGNGQDTASFYLYTNYDTSAIISVLGTYRLDE